MPTIDRAHDCAPQQETISIIRSRVLLGRIAATPPQSVDHLLQLADLALTNEVA